MGVKTKNLTYRSHREYVQSITVEVFANNTNLTFLYKIDIERFLEGLSKQTKLAPVGIELTTDHH